MGIIIMYWGKSCMDVGVWIVFIIDCIYEFILSLLNVFNLFLILFWLLSSLNKEYFCLFFL